MTKRKETFSFPILKNSEIISCLSDLRIHITEADLTKCRPDVLRHVYESLLVDCLDMSKDELSQPKFYGLEALRFQELHDESIPALHFIRGM